MSFQKTTGEVEKYSFREGREWAILYVDEKSGVFSVFSSWGNWAYSWAYHGRESLKHFLVQIARDRDDYFERKMTAGSNWFDRDATVKAIKYNILSDRKNHDLSKEEASECWETADEVPETSGEYYYWLRDQDHTFQRVVGEDEPIAIMGPGPSIREFKKNCLLPFAEYLKKELNLC